LGKSRWADVAQVDAVAEKAGRHNGPTGNYFVATFAGTTPGGTRGLSERAAK
jgi:hypothetical protein